MFNLNDNWQKSIALLCWGFFIDLKRWKSIYLVNLINLIFSDKLIQNPGIQGVFLFHTKSRDLIFWYTINIKFKVVMSACLSIGLFACPIITQEPVDQFVSLYWGTLESHGNVLSLRVFRLLSGKMSKIG